nr:VP4 protein [Epizootic hemorrhagic disease virus]
MPEPHAVIYVTEELVHLIKESYLPIWEIRGDETLNELWLTNGKYSSDVYAYGKINKWSYRQLRGHGMIFVSTKKMIQLNDVLMSVDVRIPREVTKNIDVKAFESIVGRRRLKLRKAFGDILRSYAYRKAIVLHGSEAETLNNANPRLHKVYGLPKQPPLYYERLSADGPFMDESTDEKLVSMLDYAIYSCEEIHYVGSGDGRTLMNFAKRSPERFHRIIWHLYDPIANDMRYNNIYVHRTFVNNKHDVMKNVNLLKRVERLLIWDVSSDRGDMNDRQWEKHRFAEDRMGEEIAMSMSGLFSMAIIKHRIPQFMDQYHVVSTYLIPQPGAPTDMYELRNIMILRGYSYVDRTRHTDAQVHIVVQRDVCKLVEWYHGREKGKKLKKMIFEFLHIVRENGLYAESEEPRADLFYLTNKCNYDMWREQKRVLRTSQIATMWVGGDQLFDYDDYSAPRALLMLECSYPDVRILDGNGAVLFLIWKYPDIYKRGLNYDPSWAMKFAVTLKEPVPDPPVPDISLCRFIGLRVESSLMRIQNPRVHQVNDELKRMGLDVSGHLYVTLLSGSYVTDLLWWFKMILEWSSLNKDEKLDQLKTSKAEVIEWKDEMAERPWHVRNDLIAALREFKYKIHKRWDAPIESWLDLLQRL